MVDGWKYYNHALLPETAPSEQVDETVFKDKKFWHTKEGYALFARWTSDYDCGYETEWWYCVKDDVYSIDSLPSKRRNKIKKGQKNFYVRVISALEYAEAMAQIAYSAFKQYPAEYRPNKSIAQIAEQYQSLSGERNMVFFGVFDRGENIIRGFMMVKEYETYCDWMQRKVLPEYEKFKINEALTDGLLSYYNERLANGYIILDGQRNLVHRTNIQEFLCKKFGFRYAYCRLHMKYRGAVGFLVRTVYPFRKYIYGQKGKLFYQLGRVLQMEEICRAFQEN